MPQRTSPSGEHQPRRPLIQMRQHRLELRSQLPDDIPGNGHTPLSATNHDQTCLFISVSLPEHVPPQHRNIDGLWSRRWFTDRARSFGPATVQIIEQILDRQRIEAQGYLDCQNILAGLGKRNRERLEAACQELLNRHGQATYTTLKRIMAGIDSDQKKPRPVAPAASTRKRSSGKVAFSPSSDVFVRDASHYATGGQEAGR